MKKTAILHEYDGEFIVRLKKGDRAAFDELFHVYFSRLYHFANTIICNSSLAQDIVQEFFVTLWTKRNHLDETQSLSNYLYVSIRNSCYTYLTRHQQHISLEEVFKQPFPAEYPPEEDPRHRLLWNAVENLPLQQKIIFKLIVVEECSYKEVANRLDISVNTIKTQVQRACRKLKESLPPSHFFLLILLDKIARMHKK